METSIERGKRIRDARVAKGFKNQAQLAVKLNMSVNTLSALESGRKVNTRTSILALIGKELDLSFEI